MSFDSYLKLFERFKSGLKSWHNAFGNHNENSTIFSNLRRSRKLISYNVHSSIRYQNSKENSKINRFINIGKNLPIILERMLKIPSEIGKYLQK